MWKDANTGEFVTEVNFQGPKKHPLEEYSGLDVRLWLKDNDGLDVCISAVPDDTTVETITEGSKNAVIQMTEDEYNTIANLIQEMEVLEEARSQAEIDGEHVLAVEKHEARDAKYQEAKNLIP